MTARGTVTPRSSLILATDLDGTFAGGTAEDRTRLQRVLTEMSGATLIYVTGRCVAATRELMAEAGLPLPDVLIADVGTTVVRGEEFTPVAEIERMLEQTWPGGEEIRRRLEGTPGIREQDLRVPRRVSYWLTEGPMEEALRRVGERLEGMNLDLVGSADTYIDVLPGGVNKGSTLLRVLKWMDRAEADVVVAGDTLNDLALFETGLAGVVVGNCEVELRNRVGHREHLYFAEGEGAAGILEGLRHFGWTREEIHGE
jgi:hydroxymethylpyrimidine pyrophosphatase-like HAD family hydrolase